MVLSYNHGGTRAPGTARSHKAVRESLYRLLRERRQDIAFTVICPKRSEQGLRAIEQQLSLDRRNTM